MLLLLDGGDDENLSKGIRFFAYLIKEDHPFIASVDDWFAVGRQSRT